MNLKKLSDSCLLEQTDRLVRNERKLLAEILHHLREIERRRLFAQLGFKSLFEYAVKRLGYPDDQAGRRIAAMRLLKELPELEEKIADGSLTLTNIGMAQTVNLLNFGAKNSLNGRPDISRLLNTVLPVREPVDNFYCCNCFVAFLNDERSVQSQSNRD